MGEEYQQLTSFPVLSRAHHTYMYLTTTDVNNNQCCKLTILTVRPFTNDIFKTVFHTNIFIPPGVDAATSSKVSSVCGPCVWFREAINYAGSVISCGWWPSTCIRHEASEVTIPYCLNVGQGQWFLWPLRERAESIHTIVSNSTTKNNTNNFVILNKAFK